MKSFKKIGALVMATAMLASSINAFACANDTFIAFDQIPDINGEYGKLYMCPEKDRVVRNGSADKVEWKLAFYEAEYPHRAIETLVLDDQETGFTRFDGEYAEVNTKEVPEFWESKVPYFTYNRLYSDFTGSYEPTTVLKTDYKSAPVAKEWINKGFDKYVKIDEDSVADYSHVYGNNDQKIDFTWNVLEDLKNDYYSKIIDGVDAEGNLIFTDDFVKGKAKDAYEVFEHSINNVSWLELTGPDYATGGEMSFFPFDRIVDGSNPDWYDDTLVSDNRIPVNDYEDEDKYNNAVIYDEKYVAQNDVMKHLGLEYEDAHATIEWRTVGYEKVAPYRYYQVLYINGVPMDGSEVDIVGYDVKKEEVVEVKQDYADEVHMIEKAVEQVGYESSSKIDYVIKPFDTEAVKKVDEKVDYKVVENYLLEKVHAKIDMLPEDDQYEIRFVKVSTQPGKSKLPYIWRYTGGCADPKIEWKIAFAEAEYPYEIYEQKFVDGLETGVYRSTGKFANDVPSVSQELGQPRVLTVILEDTTNRTELEWALENTGYDFIISGNRVNVILPAELYPGHYDAWAIQLDDIITKTAYNVEK